MPEYVFKCVNCGANISVFRTINTDGDIDAPLCEGCNLPMLRDYSISGVIFKGDDWGGTKK
jgi:predicted nucleic acid-binding Zn ribbon protein